MKTAAFMGAKIYPNRLSTVFYGVLCNIKSEIMDK
jgi:hypothetical protein